MEGPSFTEESLTTRAVEPVVQAMVLAFFNQHLKPMS